MALITPILEKHDAFNATKLTSFNVQVGGGGEEFTKIYMNIQNNDTGTQAWEGYWSYSTPQGAGNYKINLSANTLSNGGYYVARVFTYNASSGISKYSNLVQFRCFEDPTLTRDNYSEDEALTDSYFTFNTIYNQSGDEPLNSITHKITNLTTDEVIEDKTEYATSTSVPYTISFSVYGFLSDNNYRYDLEIDTVNGMRASLSTNFSVSYEQPIYDSVLKLNNLCDYGVIKVESKFKTINGYGRNYSYVDDGGDKYGLVEKSVNPMDYEGFYNDPCIYWNKSSFEGTNINQNDYTFMMWFKPESPLSGYEYVNSNFRDSTRDNIYFQFGNITEGQSVDTKYAHKFDFCRNVIPNTNTFGEFIRYRVWDNINHEIVIDVRSNYLTDLGVESDKYYMYFNKNDSTIDLRLTRLTDAGDSSLSWNDENNTGDSEHMYLNKLDNLGMTAQNVASKSFTPITSSIPNEDEINGLYIRNGGYYHITIYDGQEEYNEIQPTEWTDNMMFNCNFEDNLTGGNIDVGTDIDTIFIKKRIIGSNIWLPIYDVPKITSAVTFTIYDPYCANGLEYEYAIVPCKKSGDGYIEGNYIVNQITSTFDGFVIADKNNLFKSVINVNYDATNKAEYGLIQPLNKKYPIVIHNGITRYFNGTLNCAVMGYNYMKTRKMNTLNIARERNDLIEFLNDNEVKIVKAWTGDIIVIQKIGDVTDSINSQTGYSSIGFSWVQQGDINEVELYENKILRAIDVVPPFIINDGGTIPED